MPDTSPDLLQLQAAVAGRFAIVRELGRGGMAVVFLARDLALDREVAIKLLPGALADRPEARARFLREARTAAGLSHPHIVPIHAVEEHGALAFIVMGFVEGETLGERVRRAGPLPSREAIRMVQEVAWALAHAHARGVVHRDIKPDNILLERDGGRALVTDFGIARALREDEASGAAGTPHYMAPEQAAGGEVDARSDLYALGVTAFFAVTGRLPFEADSVAGLLAKHAGDPAPAVHPLAPHLPSRFAEAIDRCLAKRPDHRFADANRLADLLREVQGQVGEAPPPVRAFLREASSAGGEMGAGVGVGLGALAVYGGFFPDTLFAGFVFLPLAALGFGLAGARLGQVYGSVRDLVRQGYDHGSIRPAVALEERRQEEEAALAPAARRGIARDTIAAVAIGALKTAAFVWLAHLDGPVWINFLGAVGAVMVPVGAVRRVWSGLRRGRPGVLLRALGGRLGRLLFWAARFGIGSRAVAGAAPTEVALGLAARDLYQALPGDLRHRFADVPVLLERLERDALALRAQGDAPAVRRRLATAVGAIEALRLDLLRLRAGEGAVEDLTRDLDEARRIGAEIDAELAGRAAVRDLLVPGSSTPT